MVDSEFCEDDLLPGTQIYICMQSNSDCFKLYEGFVFEMLRYWFSKVIVLGAEDQLVGLVGVGCLPPLAGQLPQL